MPKYMIRASYTAEGVKGLAKDGGSKRKAAAKAVIESLGGTMEAFYFAFGDDDAYVIIDAPDNAAVTAASLAINATGSVSASTTVLLTPEEVDEATKRQVSYRAPGQ